MGLTVGNTQDNFNYKVVRQFALVTVLWGIVGMLVGVILAAQLIWPDITMNISWLTFDVDIPNGNVTAAATITACQPQNVKEANLSQNKRT